jgi:hypothetical protein
VRVVLENGDFHLDIRDSSFVTEILLLGSSPLPHSAVMIYVTAEFCIQGICSVCVVVRPALLVTGAHVSKALNKNNRSGRAERAEGSALSKALVCMDTSTSNRGVFFFRFDR